MTWESFINKFFDTDGGATYIVPTVEGRLGMGIAEAAAHALLGERVRRQVWRDGLYVERNYVTLHLEVPGAFQPYQLTLEDLTTRDWEFDPSSPAAVRERSVDIYRRLRG